MKEVKKNIVRVMALEENFSDGQACGWGQSVSQTIPSFMLQLPFLLASLVVVEIELVHSRIYTVKL